MTDEQPCTEHPMTGNEITVLSVMLAQLTQLERRLLDAMKENADAARDRWSKHDAQHVLHDAVHDEWEKGLAALGHRFDTHLRKEEDEDLIFDARIKPVKTVIGTMRKEWRTISIIALLLADFGSRLLDDLGTHVTF